MYRPKACIIIATLFLISCAKNQKTAASSSQFSNSDVRDDLSVSSWLLYMYKDAGMSNTLSRSDTLVFTTKQDYTYNGLAGTYYFENCSACNSMRLTLYNTPFGDISGLPPSNTKSSGEMIDIPFSRLSPANNGQQIYLWLKKIN